VSSGIVITMLEGTNLQELLLYVLERFAFDTTSRDTGDTEQSNHELHICPLRNKVFYGCYLPGHIIGGKQVLDYKYKLYAPKCNNGSADFVVFPVTC
jgi:hypothetical protein